MEWKSGMTTPSDFLILGAVGGSKVTFNPFGTGIFMSASHDRCLCTDLLELKPTAVSQLYIGLATCTRGTRIKSWVWINHAHSNWQERV